MAFVPKWTAEDFNALVGELIRLRACDIESSFIQLITQGQENLWAGTDKIKGVKAKTHPDYVKLHTQVAAYYRGQSITLVEETVTESVTQPQIVEVQPQIDPDSLEMIMLLPQAFLDLQNNFDVFTEEMRRTLKESREEKPKIAVVGPKPSLFQTIEDALRLRATLHLVGPGEPFPLVDYIVLSEAAGLDMKKAARDFLGQSRTFTVNGDFVSFKTKLHEIANIHHPA
jgi:hypothetical protein